MKHRRLRNPGGVASPLAVLLALVARACRDGDGDSLRLRPFHVRLRNRFRTVDFPPAFSVVGGAGIGLSALAWREDLDPSGRFRFVGDIASGFRARVSFPADIDAARANDCFVRCGFGIFNGSPGGGTARIASNRPPSSSDGGSGFGVPPSGDHAVASVARVPT